jgi:uncharacterized membrane protein YccC
MKSNEDNNLDRLRQSFWRNLLISILICLVGSVAIGICSQSLVAGILSYFLLSFMLIILVVYKQYPEMDQELENYWKNGM